MKKTFLRILLLSTVFFLWAVSAQAISIPGSYGTAEHVNTSWQELGQPGGYGVSWSVDGGAWGREQELYVGQTIKFQFNMHKKNVGTHYADFLKSWLDWGQDGSFDSADVIAYHKQDLLTNEDGNLGSWNTPKVEDYWFYSTTFTLTNDHIGDLWLRARVACSESIWGGAWNEQWNQTPEWYEKNFSPTKKYYQGEVEEWQLTVNPVPEPATMMLFGIGLLGLARFGRKQQ